MIGVWWFFVHTHRGQILDTLSYQGGNIGSWRVSDHFETMLEVVSVQGVALTMVLVALTALLRRRFLLGLEAAVVVAGANLSTRVLKYHVLYRLNLVEGPLMHNSYPSGHTTAAASAMVAALLVAPRALRSVVAVVGAGVMLAFGYGTFVAHWHRPSDVVGGYLVCLCWAIMALCVNGLRHWLVRRRSGEQAPSTSLARRTVPGLMVAAGTVGLAVAAACLWQSWPVSDPFTATRQQYLVAMLGGAAGIAGVAFAGMGVLLRLVQLHDVDRRSFDQPA
ncbi:hypothetical protein GCM10009599_09240 [Luteococcus peritonei]